MRLQNFSNLSRTISIVSKHDDFTIHSEFPLYNLSGELTTIYLNAYNSAYAYTNYQTLNMNTFSIGSSNEAGDVTDYNLKDEITDVVKNPMVCEVKTIDGVLVSNNYISGYVKNESTIKEIGLIKNILYNNSTTTMQPVMMFRHILETPIHLEAGEFFALNVKITI